MFEVQFNQTFENAEFNIDLNAIVGTHDIFSINDDSKNDYRRWCQGKVVETLKPTWFKLNAISYCSHFRPERWNIVYPELSYFEHIDGTPRLSLNVCDKICSHMEPAMKSLVEDTLKNKYVLDSQNFTNLQLAVAYFITFPIAIVSRDYLNEFEVNEILDEFKETTLIVYSEELNEVKIYKKVDESRLIIPVHMIPDYWFIELIGSLLVDSIRKVMLFIKELYELDTDKIEPLFHKLE